MQKLVGPALGGDDLAGSQLHRGVLGELLAREPQELGRRRAVAGQEAVQRVRGGVAVPAVVEDEHRAPAAAEHQRGAEAGGAGADDDDVSPLSIHSVEDVTARAIAAKRGSLRSDSRSGSRRTRSAVSAGRRSATRSSESKARSASPVSAYMQAM